MRLLSVALIVCSALSACTPSARDGSAPGDRSHDPSPETRRGGTVDVGIVGEPLTLDPYDPSATDLTRQLIRPVYPSLYRSAPDGTPYPDLAAVIRRQGEGVLVELEEARWSNGRRIDALDVARSVRRARPPSGFAGLRARVHGRSRVFLSGRVRNWERRLARAAFVLPRGRFSERVSGGPLRIVKRVPGLKIVYEARSGWGQVNIDRVRVFSYLDMGTLRGAVGEDGLHVAVLPSTVNLAERVEEGIDLQRATGWEVVWLDLRRTGLSPRDMKAVAAALDRQALEEGFVRGDGRISDTLAPGPGPRGADGSYRRPETGAPIPDISLAVPEGDELLSFVRRAVQLQLAPEARVDLVTLDLSLFYGAPDRARAARLVRSSGAPGWRGLDAQARDGSAVPLFHVDTFAAIAGIEGVEVNPTFDGILWNVHRWQLTADG